MQTPDKNESTGTWNLKAGLAHKYQFEPRDSIEEWITGDVTRSRFTVEKHLGYGGFSEVYLCMDHTMQRAKVAVKILAPTNEISQEAPITANLRHPHIVGAKGAGFCKDGKPFIVFDYIAGKTLEKRLEDSNHRLELNKYVLEMFTKLADALDYAHSEDVIHRDIKPSNIIIGDDNKPYLTDFGLAKTKRSEDSFITDNDLHHLGGTIPYMAPEQLKGDMLWSKKSDLYSFGVVVYEVLTGQLPYKGRNNTEVVVYIASDNTPPLLPTIANPNLPKRAEVTLLRMLSKDPDERYKTAVSFIKDLRDILNDYAEANTLYQKAKDFIEARQWREALTELEILHQTAPGHKEEALLLEQVRPKVRLLDSIKEAEVLIQKK